MGRPMSPALRVFATLPPLRRSPITLLALLVVVEAAIQRLIEVFILAAFLLRILFRLEVGGECLAGKIAFLHVDGEEFWGEGLFGRLAGDLDKEVLGDGVGLFEQVVGGQEDARRQEGGQYEHHLLC